VAKYKVLIEHAMSGAAGVKEVEVEAAAIYESGEWVNFSQNSVHDVVDGLVAAFPRSRVVSITRLAN
jgi:hypothetical protein